MAEMAGVVERVAFNGAGPMATHGMDLAVTRRSLLTLLVLATTTSSASSAASPALRASNTQIAGTVTDVVIGSRHLLVSHTASGIRRLSIVEVASGVVVAGPAVPATAVAVDLCDDRVVFVDERGLVDDHDVVVLAHAPLLPLADPTLLPATPICPGKNERLLVAREGIVVVSVDANSAVVGAPRLLRLAHQARAYAGTAGRSLRGERAYATAISVYAPRLFSIDVDADGDRDLVVSQERGLSIFLRGVDGTLSTSALRRDLAVLVGAASTAELRVRSGPAATLVVTVSDGALPEYSDVVVVGGPATAPLSVVNSRQRIDGLALVAGHKNGQIVVGRVTTDLMALSGVVLTGRVTIDLFVGPQLAASLPTAADVRAGRIDGAIPVIDVDIDNDGIVDVVDLGDVGKARLWRGTATGFEKAGDAVAISRLERAVADVEHHQVILIGRAAQKGTTITRLQLVP